MTMQPTKLQLAWAAGFVDGEGYIGLTRNFDKVRGYYSYRIQIEAAQVIRTPINLLHNLFGRGRVGFGSNPKRGYWYWRTFGIDAIRVAEALLPYLIVKRRQAEYLLEYEHTTRQQDGLGRYRTLPAELVARRAAIWTACVELNGGRAIRQPDRLSEGTPTATGEGDAIVGPDGKERTIRVVKKLATA